MLIRLIAVLMIMVFVHLIKNNRGSAHIVLFFLMTTQIVNVLFHIFFSVYFADFSPGTVTAILLYLPVNYLIFRAAFNDGFLKSYRELVFLFLAGVLTFTLFELVGPEVVALTLILMPIYYALMNKKDKRNVSS